MGAIIHRLVAKVEDLGRRNDRTDQCINHLSTEVFSWRAKYDQCVHANNKRTQAASGPTQLSPGARDMASELGQLVKVVSDDLRRCRTINQVQFDFESLSGRVAELIARADKVERSLAQSGPNRPTISGANLRVEELDARVCQISRLIQTADKRWSSTSEGTKWVKDQLCEKQTTLEIVSRERKSYTDKQNTHNMAVSTTLNGKIVQLLGVVTTTAQRIHAVEIRRQAVVYTALQGRRSQPRNPDKRPPQPGPPDNDPPPPTRRTGKVRNKGGRGWRQREPR